MTAIIAMAAFVHNRKILLTHFQQPNSHQQTSIDIHPSHVCCLAFLLLNYTDTISSTTDTIKFLPKMSRWIIERWWLIKHCRMYSGYIWKNLPMGIKIVIPVRLLIIGGYVKVVLKQKYCHDQYTTRYQNVKSSFTDTGMVSKNMNPLLQIPEWYQSNTGDEIYRVAKLQGIL